MLWVANMHSTDVPYRIVADWSIGRWTVSSSFAPHHTADATALNSNLAFAAVNLMLPIEYMNYALFILLYFEYIMEFIAHIHVCANGAACSAGQYVNLLHEIVCTHWATGTPGYRKRLFGHVFLFCSSPFCSGSR